MIIEIDEKEYEQLIEDQKLLRALEECGVDNWECYSEAVNIANHN
jgi:hypothetical protein